MCYRSVDVENVDTYMKLKHLYLQDGREVVVDDYDHFVSEPQKNLKRKYARQQMQLIKIESFYINIFNRILVT